MWPISPGGLLKSECESRDTTAGGFLDLISSRARAGDQRVWPRFPTPTRPAGKWNSSDKLKYQRSARSVSGVYL